MLWHQAFVNTGRMDATHRARRFIPFVQQPCLVKAWKITSYGNSVSTFGLDCVWSQNACWIITDSVDDAGQGIQVDLSLHVLLQKLYRMMMIMCIAASGAASSD